ncbi:MAG TPA: PIN domain-containing protein [Polyangia bacterium]
MNVYLESSAALRDLLDGADASEVRSLVAEAAVVATSRLTLAEVARVLVRLRVVEPTIAAAVAAREAQLQAESELWAILPVDEEIWARCARPFPVEPIRLLDAVHLASIEKLSAALPALTVISMDDRVRRNAAALGFAVRP